MRPAFLVAAALTAAIAGTVATAVGTSSPALPPPRITVTSNVPGDITPSAQSATLAQAAAFAWEEFFALNWTALTKDGTGKPLRDTPDLTCPFGNPVCGANRPLVWQTFRGKVEIFPGTGTSPVGFTTPSPGAPTWSYGYDTPPTYLYAPAPTASPGATTIAACTGQSSGVQTPWVNLDENDQIGEDSMYAGAGTPAPNPTAAPGTANSQPQLVRFVAKANRAMYSYIEGNGLWTGGGGRPHPVAYASDPPPAVQPYGTPAPSVRPTPYISFPTGTIETKSGWRVLTGNEIRSGRFITARPRYYESANGSATGPPCWRQGDTFGLVALHIIQKTPSAPYFIYATFEQADNILTAAGRSIENDDGATGTGCAMGNATPCPVTGLTPTSPVTLLKDSPSVPPLPMVTAAGTLPCANIGSRLYYRNTAALLNLPHGAICVNGRQQPIPDAVVQTNRAAHQALAAYENRGPCPAKSRPGLSCPYHSPFEHYKLAGVQYFPIDKQTYGTYVPSPGPSAGVQKSIFYLADIVVETDHPLQLFSGGLHPRGSNTDNSLFFGQKLGLTTYKNVFTGNHVYDMGGCMGCHGAAAQQKGADFSVITLEGSVKTADFPRSVTANGGVGATHTNRTYKRPKGH